jgi:Tim17/Tim22/Tim23/Pmp24 family
MNGRSSTDEGEEQPNRPLPDFRASNIQLQTVAPALGVYSKPDYLEYNPGGRGVVGTMFSNAGLSYLMGTVAGGAYGVRQGLSATPSNRFRVQLNSVLNHGGRYGSRAGNTLGVFSVLYSLYEGLADHVSTCARAITTMIIIVWRAKQPEGKKSMLPWIEEDSCSTDVSSFLRVCVCILFDKRKR